MTFSTVPISRTITDGRNAGKEWMTFLEQLFLLPTWLCLPYSFLTGKQCMWVIPVLLGLTAVGVLFYGSGTTSKLHKDDDPFAAGATVPETGASIK